MTDRVPIEKGKTYVFPDSACMLAIDRVGNLLFVEQHRKPLMSQTIELPGGAVRHDEGPEDAAVREFTEETGLRIINIKPMFSLDLDLSTSIHRTHVYQANIGNKQRSIPEFDIFFCNLSTALRYVKEGAITHAPTVAAILAYALSRLSAFSDD